MDKLEMKQGSFIQQTQYFIPVEIDLSINDRAKVSEVFNDFFINVAKNIGNTNVIVNNEHPSVCMITHLSKK
jgi:hypothetical protein